MLGRSRTAFPLIRAVFCTLILCSVPGWAEDQARHLDQRLREVLREAGFTGCVEATLEQRLGRPLNPQLTRLGRLLWFDVVGGLHSDNTCGGCHSPTNGMGDTQSIAIGIQNNHLVLLCHKV
jgi:cytochrome c peroxidase